MDLLTIPDTAGSEIREILNLQPNQGLRISYLSGTGDVVGTYGHWEAGKNDPRVPVITYSAMFYELMHRLSAEAQVITPWPSTQQADSIRFETVGRRRNNSFVMRAIAEFSYIRQCIEKVEEFNPHVVIADTDFQPLGWKRLRQNRRLVISAHNTFWPMTCPPKALKARLKLAILRKQSQAIDAAVCTSEECRRQIYEVTASRVSGYVETPQIVKHYDEIVKATPMNLLFLGRIEESKGIFLLLEAFVELGLASRGLTLTYAGAGSASAELERRISKSDTKAVRYIGLLDANGVHNEIAKSDLVICPTTTGFNEGLALVGFEAAAHGVPSLLSSVVPAADILADACMVFDADSKAALKLALTAVAADPKLYTNLRLGTRRVKSLLYDRSLSWGSQLYKALSAL